MISQYNISWSIQTISDSNNKYLLNTINLEDNTISSLYWADDRVFLATDTINPELTVYLQSLVTCNGCDTVQLPNLDWDMIRCGHCGAVDEECNFPNFIC